MTNPWNMTAREVQVLEMLVRTGSSKVVAAELEISPKTVSELFRRAMERMNARTRLLAVLKFDRWRSRRDDPDPLWHVRASQRSKQP